MSNTSRGKGLSRRVQQLEERLAALEGTVKGVGRPVNGSVTASVFGSRDLPNSLTRTLEAIQYLREADATTVGHQTHRNRSVETIYLNQLVRLGMLIRSRVGKKVFFRLA